MHSQNNKFYVAENMNLITILDANKFLYITEDSTQRRVELPPNNVHDGQSLAAALQTALSAGGTAYTVTWTTNAQMGTVTISAPSLTTISIASRKELQGLTSWAGVAITPTGTADVSDILGTVTTGISTGTNSLTASLYPGKAYRKIELSEGAYTFDSLASELQTKLNAGSYISGYIVSKNEPLGRLQITCSSSHTFFIYPGTYLDANPYSFMGHDGPFHSCDEVCGFTGDAVIQGNTVLGASMIHTMAYSTLFINSDLGTHNDSVGPVSQTSIARKVCVSVPPGGMIHDYHSLGHDYVTLHKQSISAISFRVTDWRGQTVDMQHWSLSLILVPESEFRRGPQKHFSPPVKTHDRGRKL